MKIWGHDFRCMSMYIHWHSLRHIISRKGKQRCIRINLSQEIEIHHDEKCLDFFVLTLLILFEFLKIFINL